MTRTRLAVVAIAMIGIAGCEPKATGRSTLARPATLVGAWQLDRVDVGDPVTHQRFFDEFLVFTSGHYVNSQLWRDGSGRVNTHWGEYRVANDSVYRHVMIANELENANPADRVNAFRIEGDTARFYVGAAPDTTSIWVYHRLD